MNLDRETLETLRHNDEMRREAERLRLEFEDLVREGARRYHRDVEFHARVYQVARVIDMDPDFIDLHVDRGIPQWEMALGLALKSVVAQEQMQPGGLLDFTQVPR